MYTPTNSARKREKINNTMTERKSGPSASPFAKRRKNNRSSSSTLAPSLFVFCLILGISSVRRLGDAGRRGRVIYIYVCVCVCLYMYFRSPLAVCIYARVGEFFGFRGSPARLLFARTGMRSCCINGYFWGRG